MDKAYLKKNKYSLVYNIICAKFKWHLISKHGLDKKSTKMVIFYDIFIGNKNKTKHVNVSELLNVLPNFCVHEYKKCCGLKCLKFVYMKTICFKSGG